MAAVDPVIRGVAVSVAPSRLPPHLDRDDLIAQARVATLRAIRTYRGDPDALSDYVAVVARNAVRRTLRDAYRGKRGVRTTIGGAAAETAMAVVPDPTPGPVEEAIRSEQRAWLSWLLERLPPKDREIVRSYYCLGETDAEIAARLGCRRATVTGRRLDSVARLKHLVGSQDV